MAIRRFARLSLVALASVACVLLAGGLVVRHVLLASLPRTDGSRALSGLTAPVRVDRDALGIPTVRGANRLDVARATGFIHAQDRFFEMDLARRVAAGELSELVGPAAVAIDKANRIHRFRAVARAVLARARPADRALLEAYADGVNGGFAALGARPPEYLLLRSGPAPWRPEDCILVIGAMFGNDLANARRERDLGLMYDVLPAPLVEFLRPLGDEWDAPLVGGAIPPPPMPGPDVFTLQRLAAGALRTPRGDERFEHAAETIKVKDGDDVRFEFLSTIWGPIVGRDTHGRPLASATWGSTTGRISHPMSGAVPWLAPWLDMPDRPLPGDVNMPRVRMPSPHGEIGASLRMVVSPGHEEAGIFHMPAGESGHPLSPHYGDMQASWVEGRATPFLPGRTAHTLVLQPTAR